VGPGEWFGDRDEFFAGCSREARGRVAAVLQG